MAGQPVVIYDQYGKAISSENALPVQLTGSIATNAAAITPGTAFAATLALYVGGAGNLEVELSSGSTVTLNSVVAGTVYPLSAVNVIAAGTTATGLVALYG